MSQDAACDPLANEVMVTIIDRRRALHGAMPAGLADIALAALTFEPETLKELEAAIARYDTSVIEHGFLKHLKTGANETPWDAGVLIIDLPARLIAAATEPSLYQPSTHGFVFYCLNPPPDWSRASTVSEEEMKPVHYTSGGRRSGRPKLNGRAGSRYSMTGGAHERQTNTSSRSALMTRT